MFGHFLKFLELVNKCQIIKGLRVVIEAFLQTALILVK